MIYKLSILSSLVLTTPNNEQLIKKVHLEHKFYNEFAQVLSEIINNDMNLFNFYLNFLNNSDDAKIRALKDLSDFEISNITLDHDYMNSIQNEISSEYNINSTFYEIFRESQFLCHLFAKYLKNESVENRLFKNIIEQLKLHKETIMIEQWIPELKIKIKELITLASLHTAGNVDFLNFENHFTEKINSFYRKLKLVYVKCCKPLKNYDKNLLKSMINDFKIIFIVTGILLNKIDEIYLKTFIFNNILEVNIERLYNIINERRNILNIYLKYPIFTNPINYKNEIESSIDIDDYNRIVYLNDIEISILNYLYEIK